MKGKSERVFDYLDYETLFNGIEPVLDELGLIVELFFLLWALRVLYALYLYLLSNRR